MCTAYAKIIRQKLWTSQPISMAVYKSGVKNFPAVIKTHKGEHWKSYIKSTLHWEREKKNTTDATKHTRAIVANAWLCFSSICSKTKKTNSEYICTHFAK